MLSIIEHPPEPNEPLVGLGAINYMPAFRIIPALIEATGRTICAQWSKRDGRPLIGVDVAAPQKWYEELNTWKGWAAGGSTDGTKLDTPFKKSPHVSEGKNFSVWLAGSGGSGGISNRGPLPTDRWILRTTAFWGAADDGGSADPRRAGGKLCVYYGDTTAFLACEQAGGKGIARSTDSGVTWTAWNFGTNRNFTSMVLSPQYDQMYVCADGRGAASTDGVWRVTGLTGTVSMDRMDNAGTANPGGMVDLRCVAVGREGTTDILLVVCGNKLHGDSKRGLWRVRVIPTFAAGPGAVPNQPMPRHVTTKPEAAARILGYIFGDGNPDQSGSPLAGGVHLTTIIPDGIFKTEALRCCSVLGWVNGTDYRLSGAKNNLQVSKQSLVAGLNFGGASAYTTTDDFYFFALAPTSGHSCNRVQGQAFLASLIEVEGQAGTNPPKIMDEARPDEPGHTYSNRLIGLRNTMNFATVGLDAFIEGVGVRCSDTKLSAYPLPLLTDARYPGSTLADWPENPADTGTGGTVTGFTYVWEHVYTPGVNDRMQCVDLWRPDGALSTGRTHCVVNYFDSNVTSTGTYTLSADAGGTTENFKETITRLLNVDLSTGSVVKEVLSIGGNVSQTTKGTRHTHVQAFTGEPAVERSIIGGQSYAGQDQAIHDDGKQMLIVGKNTPWYCPDITAPLAQVRFYPFSKGCGALSGGVAGVFLAPDEVFVNDDDRGGFWLRGRAEPGPVWVASDDVHGFIPADGNNVTNSAEPCLSTPGSVLMSRANGKGYRIDLNRSTSHGQAVDFGGVTDVVEANGFFEYRDASSTIHKILVTRNRIYKDGTLRHTFAASNTDGRTSWRTSGDVLWVHVPSKGVYRSVDNGVTWILWWDKTIVSTQARWFGHITADDAVPNTLYIAFDNGGVWKIANAHTAAAGSGTAGSVPTGAAKISGGTMTTTTIVGPLVWDEWNDDLWAVEMPVTGGAAKLQCLRKNAGTTWESFSYQEMDEGGSIVQSMKASDGELIMMTAGMGTLRRMM